MLTFLDFNKNKEKKYEIVKSRSGLPMFVLDNPLTQDDDEDSEVEVVTDLEIEIEIDKPKEKSIPQQVSDYITKHF